jgi:hypothetical protein
MKNKLLLGAILAVALASMGATRHTATPLVLTHVYICQDRNPSLQFNVEVTNGTPSGPGLIYIEKMLIAQMTVERDGPTAFAFKGKVNALPNPSRFAFLLREKEVWVVNLSNNARTLVCHSKHQQL